MRFKPKYVLVAALVLVLVPLLYFVSDKDRPGMKQQSGDVITKNVSSIEPNAVASFDIVLQEGGDAVHESDHIFESLQFPAIQSVSLDTKTLKMDVRYDSAQIDEAKLRQALLVAGYVEPNAEDAVAAVLSADGASQEITIAVGATLDPPLFKIAAGIPAKINFGAGRQHLAFITIPKLGIKQDLLNGATIQIDDPVPGSYGIVCAEEIEDARLIVE